MILCSTIIPTVNRPSLEKSVRSALEQDLGPDEYEILVCNNSDSPLPQTEWLNAPQVKVIDTHSNVNDASNFAAKLASGKYLHFLHDDDYILPGAIKSLVDVAETSGAYWICGSWNLVDDDGQFISEVRPQIKGNIFVLLVSGECLHLAASIVDREAFLQVGGYDLEIFGQSDIDLEAQIALLSDFVCIDQMVAVVRVSGGKGKTHDWTERTKRDFRKMREKSLNSDDAYNRMKDSVKGNVFLRGRASRAYLFSSALNILDGKFLMAFRRLVSFFRLTSYFFVFPKFWRGILFRSHWHNIQRKEQEEYYKKNYPSENTGFWRI